MLFVNQDKPAYPLRVLRPGADAVMLDPDAVAHMVEQFGRRS